MSDFEARIVAKLDTSEFESKINAIKNTPIVLDNIKIGNINFNDLVSQFNNASKNITSNAQRTANAISSSLNKIGLTNGGIGNMQRMLQGAGFNKSSIATITKDFQNMDIAVSKIKTSMTKNGNIRMNIQGVDELKRAVTIVRDYNAETGKISNSLKSFSMDFNKSNVKLKPVDTSNIESLLKTNKIEASISGVTSQFERLGNTGHEKLSSIKADIETLKSLQREMGTQSGQDLVNSYEKFDGTLKKVKNDLSIVSSENKAFKGSLEIDRLDNSLISWTQKNTKALRTFGKDIEDIRNKLQEFREQGRIPTAEAKEIQANIQSIKTQAALNGETGLTFGDSLKNAFSNIRPYVSVATVFHKGIRTLKDMYDNVHNIDTEMTELKKVTNETGETYSKFLKNAAPKAKQIGTSIADYVTSTAGFARLGYSLNEAESLAKAANVYNVVGDEIDGIDEATKNVVSTMTAFHIEAKDTMQIVDKFNEVGNNFAISSGGIGEAMERSASSLYAANNSLDQSIALVTAANTVVQNPESVGTAFKTISMRVRGAKTELEEAGLETDGMAKSTAKLREEISALSGVDIMLDETTFKSTYDIMDELSVKWGDLTDIQQASITELLAGKRQANVISSLLENFDIARRAVETSSKSEGSAMAEHEKWMESLDAKTKRFKATWEGLSMSFMDSSFLKGMIDTGTGALDIITKIIDKVGTLPALMGVVSAGLSLKNIGRDKMFSPSIDMPIVVIVLFGYKQFRFYGLCNTQI